jgi:hypothetical protein
MSFRYETPLFELSESGRGANHVMRGARPPDDCTLSTEEITQVFFLKIWYDITHIIE